MATSRKNNMMKEHQSVGARSEIAVEVQNLVKRYPRMPFNSVDGISFSIRRGEAFGLLGPNGAGKTTTISILTTRMLPTSGTIKIMGYDIVSQTIQAKKCIAVVPQQSNLDQSLRVRDILIYHAAYHGIGRAEREKLADQRLEEFGLTERKYDKVGYYSGGMGQRLMIARALMHQPDVLFLDEPTNRLDPQSRLFLWERIQKLKEQGITILLTTHDMDEAEILCDRIAIMDRGHILVLDTASELKKIIPGGNTLEIQARLPQAIWSRSKAEQTNVQVSTHIQEALRALPGVNRVNEKTEQTGGKEEQETTTLSLYTQDAASIVPHALHILHSNFALVKNLHFSQPGLEDVFIYLTGRKIRT
jgi:ABC-2 type transport system ATP-binding protein